MQLSRVQHQVPKLMLLTMLCLFGPLTIAGKGPWSSFVATTLSGEKAPKRYHDQTWILNSQIMEAALGVPSDSEEAVIVVLDILTTLVLSAS